PDELDRAGDGGEPHHAGAAPDRAARGEDGRAGERVAPGDDPHDAAAVLVGLGLRLGRLHVLVPGGDDVRVGQVRAEPDVDQFDHTAVGRARIDQKPRLVRPEGDGDVGVDGGALHAAGARVDPAGDVAGD